MNSRRALGVATIFLGVLVAITPRYLFPVCEYHGVTMNMMGKSDFMHCHYTAAGALLLGAIIGVTGLAILWGRVAESGRLLALVLAAASGATALLPVYLLPVCDSPEMACNQGAKQLLIVLGIAGVALAAGLVANSRRDRQPTASSSLPNAI